MLAILLILACAFHSHHCNWADVAAFTSLQRAGLCFQAFKFVVGLQQRMLPLSSCIGRYLNRQLDHFLVFKIHAGDIDQQIAKSTGWA